MLFRKPLHPYTEGLMASMPALEGDLHALYSIPGRIPDPDEAIAGCRFGPRCSHAEPVCSAAPPELVERVVAAIGVPLIARYSMTECPSITGTRPGDDPEVLFSTVGRPQAGIELQLVGEDLQPVAPGEVGRIRVRADQVMRGYWRDPEQTAQVLSDDGWLLTSDLGRLRPDGNLVLAGRSSEMYIRGGYNVYPIEVERVLADHPQVKAAAVIGRTTPVIGEIGVAFVEPVDADDPPSLQSLRAWVGSELADYKAPDALVIIDALPLNSVMKIDKVSLREQLASAEVISTR